jgi:hypothetical protein
MTDPDFVERPTALALEAEPRRAGLNECGKVSRGWVDDTHPGAPQGTDKPGDRQMRKADCDNERSFVRPCARPRQIHQIPAAPLMSQRSKTEAYQQIVEVKKLFSMTTYFCEWPDRNLKRG